MCFPDIYQVEKVHIIKKDQIERIMELKSNWLWPALFHSFQRALFQVYQLEFCLRNYKQHQQYFEAKLMQGQSNDSHRRQQELKLFRKQLKETKNELEELELKDSKYFEFLDFKKFQQLFKGFRIGLSEIKQLIGFRESNQASIFQEQKSQFNLIQKQQLDEPAQFSRHLKQNRSINIGSVGQDISGHGESYIQLEKECKNQYHYLKPDYLLQLQQLDLIDNLLRDQGIQELSRQHFEKMENLRKINLNGNDISVVGLGHLVLNTWHKGIVYVLDVVKIKNNHFGFHAGESIRVMKDCLCQGNTQISHDQIDRLQRQNKAKLFQALYLMLQIPFQALSNQQSLSSEAIQEELQKQSKKYINSESILLILKNLLQSNETKVKLSQKSNIRSQLSMKVLFSGMQYQRIMFEYRYKQDSQMLDYLKHNPRQMILYQKLKIDIAQNYGFSLEDIILHNVFKGLNKACFSLDFHKINLLPKMGTDKFSTDLTCKKLVIIPYFESFNFTQDDLLNKQERIYDFPRENTTKLEWRGGAPYFMPVYCKRFGIKTKDLYDNKSSIWFEMSGRKGQWPVCFQGMSSPSYIVKNITSKLKSMMDMQKLESVERYKFWQDQAVNKPKQRVVYGIQCSPLFTTALQFATPCETNGETYYILLQARCNPEAIKIAQLQEFWIINESYNLRPYGLILVRSHQYKQLQRLAKQKMFYHNYYYKWEFWRQQFQKVHKQTDLSNPIQQKQPLFQ